MTKKMHLPDEMLDGLSGGTMTLNDETVSSYDLDEGAFTVHTSSGSYRYTFSAEEKAAHLADPAKFGKDAADVAARHSSTEWVHDLEPSMFKKI